MMSVRGKMADRQADHSTLPLLSLVKLWYCPIGIDVISDQRRVSNASSGNESIKIWTNLIRNCATNNSDTVPRSYIWFLVYGFYCWLLLIHINTRIVRARDAMWPQQRHTFAFKFNLWRKRTHFGALIRFHVRRSVYDKFSCVCVCEREHLRPYTVHMRRPECLRLMWEKSEIHSFLSVAAATAAPSLFIVISASPFYFYENFK